jgi:T5SS/PEP-CTERM-associated repeat protein
LLAAAAAAASLGLIAPASALAVDYSWIGPTGTFQNPLNWTGGPMGTFPNDSGDNAIFDLSNLGYTVTFTAGVTNNALRIRDDMLTFDLDFNLYSLTSVGGNISSSLVVGEGPSDDGHLTLIDGTVAGVNANIGLSGDSTGTVIVLSGAVMNFSGTTVVGSAGIGTLNLAGGDLAHNGISLGVFAGGSGTLTLTTSSASALGSGALVIGQGGNGDLLIESGGDVTGSTCTIAQGSLSTSSVTVVGQSSTLTTTGTMVVGSIGDATLAIKNAGSVTCPGLTMASSSGSSGLLQVSGAGALLSASSLFTAGNAGAATINLEKGGVISSVAVNFATLLEGSADVTLSDTLTAWNANGSVTVGGAGAVSGGTAVLTIKPGATFNNSSGTFRINAPGTVNLDGGTLTAVAILNNGAFNFTAGTLNLTGGGVQLVVGPGGLLGSTVLLDASRRINVTNSADIASAGLLIVDGGSLSAGVLTNIGEIQLTDPASTLGGGTIDNNGRLLGNGRVTASITNFSTAEIRAASAADRLLFTSTFTNTNNGAMNALNGGTVEFTNALTNNGQINLGGGIVKVGGVLTNATPGRIAGRGTLMTGALTNNGQLTLSAGVSDVFGNITNNPTSDLIVTGGGTATFYQNITSLAGAEIRVSANSTAVFLGNVSGPATYTGSGLKIFEGSFSATDAIDTPGSTIVESSATLTSKRIRESSLEISGHVHINPNGTADATSRLGQLTIFPGGTMDLSDNKLIVVAGPLGAWNGSAYTGITGLVDSGRGNASNAQWDGSGIITRDTRAVNNNDFCSLGVARAGDVGKSIFGGLSVAPDDVLVMFTYGGDANLDGKINIDDYGQIDFNVGSSGSVFGWFNGDFNYDGKINIDDYGIIDFNVVAQGPPFAAGASAEGLAAVPEPVMALAPLALLSARCLNRRRRASVFSDGA